MITNVSCGASGREAAPRARVGPRCPSRRAAGLLERTGGSPASGSRCMASSARSKPGVHADRLHTVTLSEVDDAHGARAAELVPARGQPMGAWCGQWTPDAGYVDWATLGAQVFAAGAVVPENTSVEACTLAQSNGSMSASTGATLTMCGAGSANNLFEQNQPLSVSFSVSKPDRRRRTSPSAFATSNRPARTRSPRTRATPGSRT